MLYILPIEWLLKKYIKKSRPKRDEIFSRGTTHIYKNQILNDWFFTSSFDNGKLAGLSYKFQKDTRGDFRQSVSNQASTTPDSLNS